jgi:hypothetical protein
VSVFILLPGSRLTSGILRPRSSTRHGSIKPGEVKSAPGLFARDARNLRTHSTISLTCPWTSRKDPRVLRPCCKVSARRTSSRAITSIIAKSEYRHPGSTRWPEADKAAVNRKRTQPRVSRSCMLLLSSRCTSSGSASAIALMGNQEPTRTPSSSTTQNRLISLRTWWTQMYVLHDLLTSSHVQVEFGADVV